MFRLSHRLCTFFRGDLIESFLTPGGVDRIVPVFSGGDSETHKMGWAAMGAPVCLTLRSVYFSARHTVSQFWVSVHV